ncbi:MAG: toll/interleukin-1 receptor domain-containing protein [Bryobacterales bacterium]|nr:toll/interleukin-1 receptor domain-containing protein [Bryobacterales bacterium]
MGRKIFISYSHRQKDWVRDKLVACLRAGGTDVVIDDERMRVGGPVVGQMDTLQDGAEASLLVLTNEYLASEYCRHEMDRAVAKGAFLVVRRDDCSVPDALAGHLHADLRPGSDAGQWTKLLEACEADLGCGVVEWLEARDDARRYLQRGDSVNLVVSGRVRWRELVACLEREMPTMRRINQGRWGDGGPFRAGEGDSAGVRGYARRAGQAAGFRGVVGVPEAAQTGAGVFAI